MSLRKVLTGRVSHTLLSSTFRTPTAAFCTASQTPNTPRYSLASKIAVAVPAALLGSWIVLSKDPGTRIVIAFQLPVRLARDVACAATVAAGSIPLNALAKFQYKYFCMTSMLQAIEHVLDLKECCNGPSCFGCRLQVVFERASRGSV